MNLLHLATQIAANVRKIYNRVESLNRKIRRLSRRVRSLENQLQSGLTNMPGFTEYFSNRTGQTVQVHTMFVTLEGVVVSTADDGVQLREASGDLVLIPFAKITSVQ